MLKVHLDPKAGDRRYELGTDDPKFHRVVEDLMEHLIEGAETLAMMKTALCTAGNFDELMEAIDLKSDELAIAEQEFRAKLDRMNALDKVRYEEKKGVEPDFDSTRQDAEELVSHTEFYIHALSKHLRVAETAISNGESAVNALVSVGEYQSVSQLANYLEKLRTLKAEIEERLMRLKEERQKLNECISTMTVPAKSNSPQVVEVMPITSATLEDLWAQYKDVLEIRASMPDYDVLRVESIELMLQRDRVKQELSFLILAAKYTDSKHKWPPGTAAAVEEIHTSISDSLSKLSKIPS